MNNMLSTVTESSALVAVAGTLAEWLYSALSEALLVDERVTLVVRDVWAVLEADNMQLQVTTGDEFTKQKLDPGTYVLVQVEMPYVAEPAERGLYAFPLEG
jgi:hypothetical protein